MGIETDLIKEIRQIKRQLEVLEQRQFDAVNGKVYVGSTTTDAGVTIDGEETRILINDGSDNRVLIGKGVGLF